MTQDQTPLLGEILLEAGLISDAQLAHALEAQRITGGRLGQNLILDGSVTRLQLYGCLAQQLGVPFVNLMEEELDEGILDALEPATLIQAEWIPFHKEGDTLTVATSVPFTAAMRREAKEAFGVTTLVLNVTTDWDISQAVMRDCRNRLLFKSAEELASDYPDKSAKHGLRLWQKIGGIIIAASLIIGMVWVPAATTVTLLVLANIFFFIAVAFRTFTSIVGAIKGHDDRVVAKARAKKWPALGTQQAASLPTDADLPVYTILVPVFHEANIIAHIIEHLGHLDWPTSKLQVLVLLEEDDVATLQACKDVNPPEYVRLLVVPSGTPQTKPRACNFGLMLSLIHI